jgi:hypothetical protein
MSSRPRSHLALTNCIHSLALASYIYSLDGSTTYTYLAFATSTFEEHSLISSVQVAQSVIRECSSSYDNDSVVRNNGPNLSSGMWKACHC